MARILIVVDDVATASAFAAIFRSGGEHEVTEAHSGTEAIAAYERIRPDLVLLDARPPDMAGLDLLPTRLEDDPVVIMVVAHGHSAMAEGALHHGRVPRSLAEMEKAHIGRTLKANAHNRTHAAKELGISRATLIKKIKEYGLPDKPRS
jgi:DNA-binding NtrC family response regulator